MARLAAKPEPPRFGPPLESKFDAASPFGLLGYLSVILALTAVAIVVWNVVQDLWSLQTEVNAWVQNVGGLVALVAAKPFGIEPSPQLLQWIAPLLPLAASLIVWLTRLILRRA